MKKSLMPSDLVLRLQENKYLPLAEVQNKFLHTRLTDPDVDYYVKIVTKSLDYQNDKNETVFISTFQFALVAVVQNDDLLDSFAIPLNPFCIRTRQDRAAIDEILDEMETDFSDFTSDCYA